MVEAVTGVLGLQLAVGFIGLVALLSGLRGVVTGVNTASAGFSTKDPVADNDIRFFAAIWAGVGALFAMTALQPVAGMTLLPKLGSIVIAGGVVRLIAVLRQGGFRAHVPVAIFLELIAMLLLLSWRASLMSQ